MLDHLMLDRLLKSRRDYFWIQIIALLVSDTFNFKGWFYPSNFLIETDLLYLFQLRLSSFVQRMVFLFSAHVT